MADRLIAKLKLDVLRKNLVENDSAEITMEEVREFLQKAGFEYISEREWLCEEVSLRALDPTEIESVVEDR